MGAFQARHQWGPFKPVFPATSATVLTLPHTLRAGLPTLCALARTLRTVQCPPLSPFGRPHLQEHVFRNTTVPHHLLNLNGYISTGHFNTFLRGNFFDSFAGKRN